MAATTSPKRKATAPRPWGTVRLMPGGSRYQARYTPAKGKPQIPGPYTFATAEEARDWLVDKKRQLKLTGPDDIRDCPGLLVGEYVDRFLAGLKIADNTRYGHAKILGKHALPVLGGRRLDLVRRSTIDDWHAGMDGVGPAAKAKAYKLVRQMFDLAVSEGLVQRNPCRIDGAASSPTLKEIGPLSRPEFARFAAAYPAGYEFLPYLAVLCGLRRGELMEVRWNDFQKHEDDTGLVVWKLAITRQLVYLRGQGGAIITPPPKNGEPRTVFVPPQLQELLVEYIADQKAQLAKTGDKFDQGALLFPGEGTEGHLRYCDFEQFVTDAAEAADIGRPFTPHDLRHTAGTWAAKTGASIKELMEFLGHKTPAMAMVYQHTAKEDALTLARRMGEFGIAAGLGKTPDRLAIVA